MSSQETNYEGQWPFIRGEHFEYLRGRRIRRFLGTAFLVTVLLVLQLLRISF